MEIILDKVTREGGRSYQGWGGMAGALSLRPGWED